MKLSIKQVKNLAEQLKFQNDLIVSLQNKLTEQENNYKMLLACVSNHERHFEILDLYKFYNATDLLPMAIKSRKREAVLLLFPAVADVDFLKQENERRKTEIRDNVLDDDRQDEIAAQIAAKGDRVYSELSQTANAAQTAANNAQTTANAAQVTAEQAKTAAEKGISDAATANGMAVKAHETAESVQNDLALLDDVVENNFGKLQTAGYMTGN